MLFGVGWAVIPDPIELPAGADKIIATIEKLEPGLKDLTNRRVKIDGQDENKVYVQMQKPDDYYASAIVLFDRKTGELISVDASINNWKNKKIEKATDEEIMKRADTIVQELFGDKRKETGTPRLSKAMEPDPSNPNDSRDVYRFVYYPALLNGVEIETAGTDYGLSVATDHAGHLVEVSYEPIDLQGISVPDPKKALAPEAIQKQIFTPDRFDFDYVWDGIDGKPTLEYTIRTSPIYDAMTGKQIDAKRGTEKEDGKRNATTHKDITIKPQSKPLIAQSAEEAKKVLESLYGADSMNTLSTYKKNEVDNLIVHYWTEGYDYLDKYVSLIVDKSTGEVVTTENNTYREELEVPLTKEQALQKAIAFMEPYAEATNWQVEIVEPYKAAPMADWMIDIYGEGLRDHDEEEEEGKYVFYFKDLHHGVPIVDTYYRVVVNVLTGQVLQLERSLPINGRTYPVLKPSVTEQQAAEIFAKNIPLKLNYTWVQIYEHKAPHLSLVYTLDMSKGWPSIDALTGKMVWREYEEEE